jgi:hypothetical protein
MSWWKRLMQGDAEIDVRKVGPEVRGKERYLTSI